MLVSTTASCLCLLILISQHQTDCVSDNYDGYKKSCRHRHDSSEKLSWSESLQQIQVHFGCNRQGHHKHHYKNHHGDENYFKHHYRGGEHHHHHHHQQHNGDKKLLLPLDGDDPVKYHYDEPQSARQTHHHNHHPLTAENQVKDKIDVSSRLPSSNTKTNNAGWTLSYHNGLAEAALNNSVHNVTAELGGVAFLNCRVGHLGDRQISWIRRRDWHVITSADMLYSPDKRFSVLHEPGSQDWTLHIKWVNTSDNGTYECQVSTGTGIIALFVNLRVVTPKAVILGQGQYHVNEGSQITFTCIISKTGAAPQHIEWYQNGMLLNYQRNRPDIEIISEVKMNNELGDIQANISLISRLKIYRASDLHSGNYTCSAPHTIPASIQVFITEGDNMAAIQRKDLLDSGCCNTSTFPSLLHIIASIITIIHHVR